MKVKIFYHHTDCGGVVYYANYLKFLEEARTEYFEGRGLFIKDLEARGILFVVARQETDYKLPAVYGDVLEVKTTISEITGVKMWFENQVYNQKNELIAKARTLLVCIDKAFKPNPIPDEVRKKLVNQ
ncbi:MAG: thioesterase family protein [Candidatus Omnitrophota bacterium]|jgi:acyl-CoA thioester hydrolase